MSLRPQILQQLHEMPAHLLTGDRVDFAVGAGNNGLADGFTFTRAGAAGCFGADGVWYDKGVDELRMDFVYGGESGYLIERGSTNNILHNCDISNVAWVVAQATKGNNVGQSPDLANEMDSVIEDNTPASRHYVEQAINYAAANALYSASVVLQASNRDYACIRIPALNVRCYFDLVNGTVGDEIACFGRIHKVPGTTYYVAQVLVPVGATAASTLQIMGATGATNGDEVYDGAGTESIRWWGAQWEIGAPSSMIRTVAAPVARPQDLLKVSWDTARLDRNDINFAIRLLLLEVPSLPFAVGSVLETVPNGGDLDSHLIYWDTSKFVYLVSDGAGGVVSTSMTPVSPPAFGTKHEMFASHVYGGMSFTGRINGEVKAATVPAGAGSNILTHDPNRITIGSTRFPCSFKCTSLEIGEMRA